MKKIVAVILAGMMLLALGGCAANKQRETPPGQMQNLTVGLMPDVDSIPFIIAQEKGFFKDEGLNVTLKPFKSAVDRDSALQSGNLDGAVSDMLAEAFAKAGGFDTVITSLTTGSYKLVVNKDVSAAAVADLRGKAVAISKNTIIEYVTDKVLADGGLQPTDVNKIVIPQIPARLEMLQNGKITAATMPEPMATLAVKNGAKVLLGSDELNINPGVMIFTRKAVTGKEKEIQALYRAYNKAIDYLAHEPQENYIDVVIDKGGLPPGVKDTLVLPHYNRPTAPPAQAVADVMAWLQARQLIPQGYSYQDVVDDRFVR